MAKILLVEDEELSRTAIEEMLRGAGHEIISAGDGKEALGFYDPQTIDLVLTDIVMPGAEGIELIMEIRRRNSKARIMVISGGGSVGTQAYFPMAKALGAIQVLAKPFKIDQLLRGVESALSSAS